MTVKQLREKLEGVPDEMLVLIPVSDHFDGFFYTPCTAESGVSEMEINENLGIADESFVLCRHGFIDDDPEEIQKELN